MGQEYWVSTTGSDAAAGTRDEPFATLERARDALRGAAVMRASARDTKGATIWLKGGAYRMDRTFVLGEKDSGTADAPVTYRAVPGEEVRLTGGKQIPSLAFGPVADPAVLARLPEEARGKILQADLRSQGITDFGLVRPRGARHPCVVSGLEVFINDQAMQLARWPNRGFAPIGQVLDPGAAPRRGDYSRRGGVFTYDYARPDRWKHADDLWLSGFYAYDSDTLQAKAVDPIARTITMAEGHRFGLKTGLSFYFLNLLEEIDEPGEWYLDRKSGILYLWPPFDLEAAKVVVSLLEDPIVALEGVSHVTFRGIIFEAARGMGVYIERGNDNLIAGCTLRNLGTVAVCLGQGIRVDPDGLTGFKLQNDADRGEITEIEPVSREIGDYLMGIYAHTDWNRQAGVRHGIVGCDIYNTGASGIILGGGDRKTLSPGGNYVLNCHFHHCSRLDRSFCTAVNMDGAGNRVANCLIHDSPLGAIFLRGNNHTIELNDVHHVCLAEDMGVFYMGRDPSEMGNVFRNNFLHHCGKAESDYRTTGVYLDGGTCGATVAGNIFYKVGGRTVFSSCGYGHIIRNNVFVNGVAAVAPAVDTGEWSSFVNNPLQAVRLRKAVDVLHPPYVSHYPQSATFFDADPACRRGNTVENNLFVLSKTYADSSPKIPGNLVTDGDPGFVDAAGMNYQLKPGAAVYAKLPGFQRIPFERIGLYIDEYRPTLPDKAAQWQEDHAENCR